MSAKPADTAEGRRLAENDRRAAHWKRWGPYLAERAWGTVREDYSPNGTAWDYFPHDHARSRAYRWNEDGLAGISRPPPAALLRARALERQGPDPQGAALRPDRTRGQPRRGRQGVLLLPRRDADALVHEVPLQVPAGGVPVRGSLLEENRRRGDRGARVRAARHRHLRRRPLLRRLRRVRQGGARGHPRSRSRSTTAARRRPRSTCCRRSGSATPGPGAGPRAAAPRAPEREDGPARRSTLDEPTSGARLPPLLHPDAGAALHRERDERRARSSARRTRRPTSRTGSTSTSSTATRDAVNPARRARRRPRATALAIPAGGSARVRLRLTDADLADGRPARRGLRRGVRARRKARPTSSTPP